ncbi:MAG: glycosyltransferase family 2 protein [Anaerolineae bacterium]
MSLTRWITEAIALLLGLYLMWHIPTCLLRYRRGLPHPPNAPLAKDLTVIIPARNEERRLPALLRSLSRSTLTPQEVVVVDDNSADGTAALAAAWGATVVQGEPLPAGWTGKSWACWQGAQYARGHVLVFLDADTWLEPEGLACIVRAYTDRGGLFTVQPYHVVPRAYEQLSAFFNIVLMAALNAFTPHGDRLPPAGAFGPCVVCSHADYLRVGGHAAVRSAVLEDIALAKGFRAAGLPVSCYGGRGAISFRMYPDSLAQLIEGWSKGFGTGALTTRLPILLAIIVWISGCFSASIHAVGALAIGTSEALPLAVLYALFALEIGWMLRRIGSFGAYTAALFPLPLAFFAVLMLRSLVLIYLVRRVVWHGRTIRTGGRRS